MISLQNISVTFKTDKNKAIHAVQHVRWKSIRATSTASSDTVAPAKVP